MLLDLPRPSLIDKPFALLLRLPIFHLHRLQVCALASDGDVVLVGEVTGGVWAGSYPIPARRSTRVLAALGAAALLALGPAAIMLCLISPFFVSQTKAK